MYCAECGHKNRNDRKFCENCGKPLHDYTKPKEDLIYPQEIEFEQTKVEKVNTLERKFNFVLYFMLALAIIFVAISFFVGETAKVVLVALSLISLVALISIFTTKAIVVSKIKKSKIDKEK